MITHIHSASIVVTDIDRAIDFYTSKLGFAIAIDAQPGPDMRFVTLVPPGASTQLALAQANWFTPERPAGGVSGLTFSAKDVDAAYADLSAKGVEFTGPVQTEAWGMKSVWIIDPDGNQIYLAEEQG